jgi:hypothetical protein
MGGLLLALNFVGFEWERYAAGRAELIIDNQW